MKKEHSQIMSQLEDGRQREAMKKEHSQIMSFKNRRDKKANTLYQK
jgi:hypothetical protein